MAKHPAQPLKSRDIQGLKYFDRLLPLLDTLHEVGCDRDTAGKRRLHFDQYCSFILLVLFNPIVHWLRGIQQASQLRNVQRRASSSPQCPVTLIRWSARSRIGYREAPGASPGPPKLALQRTRRAASSRVDGFAAFDRFDYDDDRPRGFRSCRPCCVPARSGSTSTAMT